MTFYCKIPTFLSFLIILSALKQYFPHKITMCISVTHPVLPWVVKEKSEGQVVPTCEICDSAVKSKFEAEMHVFGKKWA